MPVKPGTPSRDRRRPPPPRNNVTATSAPTPAALQGALLAFNYATPPKSRSFMNMADRPVPLLDSDADPPPELPEPGSIKDKIAIFSSNASTLIPNSRPRSATGSVPGISRQKSPQLLAAEIAAAANSPAPASKNLSVDVQRAQSQRFGNAPRNDFPRDLPSPIPIRKSMVNPRLLDPYSDEPQGLSPPDSYFDQRPASPESSTSPQPPQPPQPPPIAEPRPPVPRKPLVPRKPSPAISLPTSTDNRFENRRLHDEPPKPPIPLRTKTSASTLPGDRPPALPPRRAATVQDVSEPPPIPRRTKSPAWPSNSSTPSFYSQSQNLSSTSVLGSVTTDVSRDGTRDAVAASSLASNRAALHARKSPPPPPPSRRRRSRSRSLLQLQSKKGRTPNPSPGGLRETLRPQAKSDDEGDHRHRHQHRRIINKHPHKHQEGDRKRWRNEVTEKERKRYEGVWAANKGLLITPGLYPPEAMDMVVNLVVRDIWSRSRLPTHVLEQVWNLVDGQKIGLLTRAEFVVGTWLIDRSLGGHKLFTEVPDSVWASVIRVPGISLEHHSKR
ncbi:hypothetical protein BDW69DRAFT_175724 [Aspergillus filifer]